MEVNVFAVAVLFLMVVNAWMLCRWLHSTFWAQSVLIGYLAVIIQILAVGYGVSLFDALADPGSWLIAIAGFTAVFWLLGTWLDRHSIEEKDDRLSENIQPTRQSEVDHSLRWTLLQKVVIGALATTVGLIVLGNLALVLLTAPHNFDSHSCHLARMATFLQQGNLDWYPANFWAHVAHPRNHPILLAFAWLVGGENLTQAVNFSAWIVLGISVFAIVETLTRNRFASSFCGLVSLLLVNVMLIGTTTQNDMVVAVHVAIAVYFLVKYLDCGRYSFLLATAFPVFVCLGIKVSTLMAVPSLMLIAGYVIYTRAKFDQQPILKPSACVAMAMMASVLTALPTGYIQNLARYGHPIGPKAPRDMHMLVDLSAAEKLGEIGKNMIRYSIDSTSLEGFSSTGPLVKLHHRATRAASDALETLGVDLEANVNVAEPFRFQRPYSMHEDFSYWGMFGVLLIWPAVISSLVFRISGRNVSAAGWVFSLSLLVFVLSQCFAKYDPWRGRYFTWVAAIILVPVATWLPRWLDVRLLRYGLVAAVCLGIFGSAKTMLHRTNSHFFSSSTTRGVFAMDRADQLSRNMFPMADVIREYQRTVPFEASVVFTMNEDYYAFPFYGQELEHQVSYAPDQPNQWDDLRLAADYLVYARPEPTPIDASRDRELGSINPSQNIFIRPLRR